jgi:hypothetical protein
LAYSGAIVPTAAVLTGFEYRIRNAAGTSNPFLLTYGRAPVALDNEANDTAETAQEVSLPCEIAGRVEKKRDRDWYTFSAKRGEIYSIEVQSERLGSPTDLFMVLRNPANKQDLVDGSGTSDDNTDTVNLKFFSRSDDPAVYRFTVPADGKYQLLIASRNADIVAGPRNFYRVRITPEAPDFQLIVMAADYYRPDTCKVAQGGHQMVTVFVLRQDGFTGEVALTAEGLPPGVTCPPQVLGSGLRQTHLAVSAAADAAPWTGEIKIKGTATIKGQEVVREARPASITWPVQPQANLPTLSRVDRSLVLAVREQGPFSLRASIDWPFLVQGDKATITVKVARHWPDLKAAVQVAGVPQPPNPALGVDLPNGFGVQNNQPVQVAADKGDGTLAVTIGTNVPPGTYNLVLRGTAQVPFNKDPMAKARPNVAVTLPSNAISVTVLPRSVATVAVTVPKPNVKPGEETEVMVRATRLFDYAGELKVQLVLPANVMGLTADDVIIPAGKDETRLLVKVAPNTAPGAKADLIVRATALLQGNVPAVQEAKFTLTVVK